MARSARIRATILALSLWFLSPLPNLWDVLVDLILDSQMEDAAGAPPTDNSTDGSDRSAALDPLG
jgi:hypothetical protein